MKTPIRAMLVVLSATFVGCGEDAPPAPPADSAAAGAGEHGGAAPPPGEAPGRANRSGKEGPGEPTDLPPLPVADIQERDFLESPTNRDPFRDFSDMFVVRVASTTPAKNEKDVLVSKYALEELKIVGIISGNSGRVLANDPAGLGWVLRVGDFVGKAEYIHGSGSGDASMPVNWRLDRIRENDVVFIRESPDPAAPASTRVLSLHTQEEMKQEIKTGIRGTRPDDPVTGGNTPSPSGVRSERLELGRQRGGDGARRDE